MKKSLFIGIIALCIYAVAAPNGPISFSMYDMNKDGTVSADEFNTVRAQRMQQMADQNRPMRNAASAPMFESFDTNHDGKLTQQELLNGQQMRRQEMMNNRQNMMGNGQKGKGKNW
jgi:Ca2+-binding EF-hand superfamily protein